MLSVTLIGDRELVAKLTAMPSKVHDALRRKVTELALLLEAKVKSDKLSGQVLNVQTGALRRSIFETVEDSPTQVVGKVASSGDVKYAAIHEFGGKIDIPEIVPVKAKALHFMGAGGDVFAKRTRAHTVDMPERSFMRSSLADMQAQITQGLRDAVRQGLS
jgi:HK97 gp10 family phage protein